MAKPFLPIALFLVCLVASGASAQKVEVAKVPMPQLAPLQWELLRQQQGSHYQPIRIDLNLTIRYGKVYSVTVRRGTGHGDIDKTIVKWIEANWKPQAWFAGGDNFVISMNVDPAIRQVVFPKA
jgi:hypothetical protein